MKIKQKKGNTQHGFTLVEFLVVLGLIFALVAVIAITANKATERTRISRAKNEVLTIVAAAESWRANRLNYSGIGLQKLCDAGLLASSICGKQPNPWGGDYKVDPVNDIDFQITIDKLPKEMAQDLADNLAPASKNQNSAKTNNDTVTATFE